MSSWVQNTSWSQIPHGTAYWYCCIPLWRVRKSFYYSGQTYSSSKITVCIFDIWTLHQNTVTLFEPHLFQLFICYSKFCLNSSTLRTVVVLRFQKEQKRMKNLKCMMDSHSTKYENIWKKKNFLKKKCCQFFSSLIKSGCLIEH